MSPYHGNPPQVGPQTKWYTKNPHGTFLRLHDNSPSKTNRPLRQIALLDKLPSRTNRPPTHLLFSTKRRRGRFVFSSDESPSYVGETNRPPVSNRKREGDSSSVLKRAICLQLGRIALLFRRDESPSSF